VSILKPIDQHGAFIPFKRPINAPTTEVSASPQVSISFNEGWTSAVMSALKVLLRPETYEGTRDEIVAAVKEASNLFDLGSAMLPVGTIIPNLLATFPANWLACDGSTYLRTTWPLLYAALHAHFIIDADHFFVPNLRGRTLLVAGSGTGLTTRVIGDQGGEETHQLTTPELASHSHTYSGTTNTTSSSGTRALLKGDAQTQTPSTNSAGSGSAHNNMQPFAVIQYSIIAG